MQPVYRLQVMAPKAAPPAVRRESPVATAPAIVLPDPPQAELLATRLKAVPEVVNGAYSLAEGSGSADIVPSLVFDDGRFTYLRFPGNRELPAVFHVLGDGSETLVNTRMEGDLLVVDRVSRRFMLRAGQAVVGIWNDAFDIDGRPPIQGTTVLGVERASRTGTVASKGQR